MPGPNTQKKYTKKTKTQNNEEKMVRRNLEVAKKRLEGKDLNQIGREVGLKRSRVGDILRRGDIKEFIEEVTKQITFVEGVTAYDNIAHAIDRYRKEGKETDAKGKLIPPDFQIRDHGFRASMDLMKSLGVLQSDRLSVSITNISNTQNNVVTPMVAELIRKHFSLPEKTAFQAEGTGEVIDAEQG
jgi:hypothetical protein